jgi:hypothetical protein
MESIQIPICGSPSVYAPIFQRALNNLKKCLFGL